MKLEQGDWSQIETLNIYSLMITQNYKLIISYNKSRGIVAGIHVNLISEDVRND